MLVAILAATAAAGSSLIAVAVGRRLAIRRLRRLRDEHSRRPALWDRFYGLDWGEVTTNNYGFAPAETAEPQRFQLQMYRELRKLLPGGGRSLATSRVLEVSCGRGGGLAHLVESWPGRVNAVGLDVAGTAIAACRMLHAGRGIEFVEGSALALPFADETFDVVLNVEASNDYGDDRAFFAEVCRVLRPGGTFLYADTRRPKRLPQLHHALRESGLDGLPPRDITANVVLACEADTPRRLAAIRRNLHPLRRLLFGRVVRNYAACTGSRKLEKFRSGRRIYFMTHAVKTDAPS